MASLSRCSTCRGFLPAGVAACPNCGATSLADRLGFLLKAAGGASVAMTLMACYGVPVDPYEPPDTDTTGGTGDTESATTTGPAESSTGSTPAESSTSAAESSTGAESSGGSESGSSDGSTGAGGVDPPSLPR